MIMVFMGMEDKKPLRRELAKILKEKKKFVRSLGAQSAESNSILGALLVRELNKYLTEDILSKKQGPETLEE